MLDIKLMGNENPAIMAAVPFGFMHMIHAKITSLYTFSEWRPARSFPNDASKQHEP